MKTEPDTFCGICGAADARVNKTTKSFGRGDDLLVIEDVPVVSCRSCGETYLTAETIHELERIKRDRLRFSTERPVRVAIFA
ncbi:MAG: type II toxin-antitoxin system MqsA family antitoxin [Acidobacteria bacterium]|nr:type II toxin-antitoxin system MqsA family antitoxin [Acidobacteriota bacterium]MBK8147926.1 type II toxin-antitoxin system MqsA family antitoxin [Acidobacteriota bacterium]MBK8813494.1 type II toxin-antitoxin system MqsA family antitoxin [Acidobacteriota bacterium]